MKVSVALICLILGVGVALYFLRAPRDTVVEQPAPAPATARDHGSVDSPTAQQPGTNSTIIQNSDSLEPKKIKEAAAMAALDKILVDQTLPNEEVAKKLLNIAASPATPVSVRLEALQNGLDLVADSDYPQLVLDTILMDPETPNALQQEAWDDMFDRDNDAWLDSRMKKLSETDGHSLQEEAANWLKDFGSENGNQDPDQ